MRLYILKYSKTLGGFYSSIFCCAAGSKEEAIASMLDYAGEYFDASNREYTFFNWSGETCYFGDSPEELADTARIKLEFLDTLKKELEADLTETDKPYIGGVS